MKYIMIVIFVLAMNGCESKSVSEEEISTLDSLSTKQPSLNDASVKPPAPPSLR